MTAAIAASALMLASCASMNNKDKGKIAGATIGAAAGAAIGHANGSTAKGAIIGAAVGGVAGAVIGHQMDQQAKEIKQNIPGAIVERVGEGIQVTFASGLLFDFDSDRIRPEAASNLANLASSLDKYPNTDLVIIGHTDDRGTDAYNDELSARRARAAAYYLSSRGVSTDRIRASGRGEREPVSSNASEEGRQTNRRVEVAIFANEQFRKDAAR